MQQGQLNMQAHTGALQQLATWTYQRNFNHIFASIPIYDRSDREGFFPWLACLEAALIVEETLKQKPWEGPWGLSKCNNGSS